MTRGSLPEIRKYIPVGCLRLKRNECHIEADIWEDFNSWYLLAHQSDVDDAIKTPYVFNKSQDALLGSPILQPYSSLLNAGWIRMEFKATNKNLGQVRVYVLPDDIERRAIDRGHSSLRRSLQLLLSQLDISGDTWNGSWVEGTPVSHVDSSMDIKNTAGKSLFELFNTLPSPNPDPEVITDRYVKEAMYRILDSDVEGLTTRLHTYQRRSAAMMLQRETQPAQMIDPRLRSLRDQNNAIWYCDLDSGTCLREARTYEAPRGGICAETMGLGKTLICLALILATREITSQIPVEYSLGTLPSRKVTGSLVDMCASTIGRNGIPWKSHFKAMETEGYDFSQCIDAIKRGAGYYFIPSPPPRRESRNPIRSPPRKIYLSAATLVVVPSNLVQQWRQEIKKHTTGLNVLVVNNNKSKLPPAVELAGFDLILFSKQRFEKESKDGYDMLGRHRNTSTRVCHCPYIGSTRDRDCTCYKEENVYHSPLKDLHFKRLITDEGHTFGNASASSKTEAVTVVEFLQLSARWIISGTPTQGLYGSEVAMSRNDFVSTTYYPLRDSDNDLGLNHTSSSSGHSPKSSTPSENSFTEQEIAFHAQERKDLEKLGNIATLYLKARPWANSREDCDPASWSTYVMQPRHGSKSRGSQDCLRATLEAMIIRHRASDVRIDVILPPLHQKIVYLDGSFQDKLALNMFSMMIVSNAVTSERKDADYLFHPRQRKALQQLVSNLRQASFFWSGYTAEDIQATLDISDKFLEAKEIPISEEDRNLLLEAIKYGNLVRSNSIAIAASTWHEMPMYVENDYPEHIREIWALDRCSNNPTLMGPTMIHASQKFVEGQLWKDNPMDGLASFGEKTMSDALNALEVPVKRRSPKKVDADSKPPKKASEVLPVLAGGFTLGDSASPKKPRIISTSSSKLSYLIDEISIHHKTEKILVFYEADNVAYYIAQALECLRIKHLIYAKSLSSARRSQYVVTFNQSELFRVLLMDVSQAAFGLDMSSASRVYFVNPVFSPQVEAQAVKRAHRIGQTKPVYVETLVLKGSIEEIILSRRKDMSTEEHNKCKTILDDRTMYDWIRNVRFLPVPADNCHGPNQMAILKTSQPLFNTGDNRASQAVHDPNADLIPDDSAPSLGSKRRAKLKFTEDVNMQQSTTVDPDEDHPYAHEEIILPKRSPTRRYSLTTDDDIQYETPRRKRRRKSVSLQGSPLVGSPASSLELATPPPAMRRGSITDSPGFI
ncbi:P-loop containing nucleoside triphosphate hydrolase protein [Xylogone sp. PMI_703]|nr:P-loop containing nucleoside triphosphate hydrolase protein [Xylogone sp. PMI_703]